jgi:hypothetical protein
MLSAEARAILERLADYLAGQIGLELVAQGHNNTGTLIESVRVDLVETLTGVVLIASNLDYGQYINDGRKPGTMPPVSALAKWVMQRGIASEQREVNSIAWAIAIAIKKQGSPTRGAYKYSKNGKRTDWIGQVLEANERIIVEHIEQASIVEVEVKFNNVIINMDKLIK